MPRRQFGGPSALPGVAQHRHVRSVRRSDRGRFAARAPRGAHGLGPGECRHAVRRALAIFGRRRDEQAPARRARRRSRHPRGRARGARLHGPGRDPRRPEGVFRSGLPRRTAGAPARLSRRAVAASAHVDQTLAVVPAHAPGGRGGARSARPRGAGRRRERPHRDVSCRARALRQRCAELRVRGEILAPALHGRGALRRQADARLVRWAGPHAVGDAGVADDGRRHRRARRGIPRPVGRSRDARNDGRRHARRRAAGLQGRSRASRHAEGAARESFDAARARRHPPRTCRGADRLAVGVAGRWRLARVWSRSFATAASRDTRARAARRSSR